MDNDRHFNQRLTDHHSHPQRRKRNHSQMLAEDARIDSYLENIPRYPPTTSDSLNTFFPPPYIRPLQSSASLGGPAATTMADDNVNVIDLTADSPPRPQQGPRTVPSRQTTQGPNSRHVVINLEDDDDDEIRHITTNPLRQPSPPNFFANMPFMARTEGERTDGPAWVDQFWPAPTFTMARIASLVGRAARGRPRPNQHTIPPGRRDPPPLPVNFQAPNLLYTQPAFPMTREAIPYQAPEPVEEGFTRTPSEGDILVCPNCDEELNTGDTDVKKQIWVVKSCGHVYCGQCATNRFKGSQRGKNANSKTFAKCVVPGCTNKSTSSAKAMFQVYI